MKTYVHLWQYLAELIIIRKTNISYESCRENKETHFMLSNYFPQFVPFVR